MTRKRSAKPWKPPKQPLNIILFLLPYSFVKRIFYWPPANTGKPELLEKAELFDASDINLYILKTDAYLAMDKQEKAVELLEKAVASFEGEEKIELLFELADVYDDYEEFDKVFDCLKVDPGGRSQQ